MRYDFDMFSTFPADIRQQFQGELNELGLGHMTGSTVALFRDPATAAALQSADAPVRQLFLDAGFGMNCENRAIPEGYFLAEEAEDHERCLLNFMRLLFERRETCAGANWQGFNPIEFLEQAQNFVPIDASALRQSAGGKQRDISLGFAILAMLGSCLVVGVGLAFFIHSFFLS